MRESNAPVPVSGLWFRSDHTGRKMTVLVEVDKEWHEVAVFEGSGQGITSHIVEPLGLRVAIEEKRVHEV